MGNGQSRVPLSGEIKKEKCSLELVRMVMEMLRLSTPASDDATSTTSGSSASPANGHVYIRVTAPDDTTSATSESSASPANGHISTLVNAAHDTNSTTNGSSALPANGDLFIRVIAPDDSTFTTSGILSPPANDDFSIRATAPDDTTSTTSGSSSRRANGDFSISTTAPDDNTRSHRILACIPIPFDFGICEPISTVASLLRNAFQPPNNNNQGLDGEPQGDDGNKKILAVWIMALLTPSLVIATALYKPASGVVFGRNKAAYYITLGAIFVAGIVEIFTAIFLSRSRNAAEKFATIALCLSILPLVAIIGIGGFAFIQG